MTKTLTRNQIRFLHQALIALDMLAERKDFKYTSKGYYALSRNMQLLDPVIAPIEMQINTLTAGLPREGNMIKFDGFGADEIEKKVNDYLNESTEITLYEFDMAELRVPTTETYEGDFNMIPQRMLMALKPLFRESPKETETIH